MIMECAICEGREEHCPHCKNGSVLLDKCPREIMGNEFIEACNMAFICGKGDWPVGGGLLDQSSWFMNLYQLLENETNRVQARIDKRKDKASR